MGLMDKVMHNISGITIGALFFAVGDLGFMGGSIIWLKNLFVFGGLFIVAVFMTLSFKQYVEWLDPNYGRVTEIEAFTEETKRASNAGKAKAFDFSTVVFALLVVLFSAAEAPWYCIAALLVGYMLIQAVFLIETKRLFRELWKKLD